MGEDLHVAGGLPDVDGKALVGISLIWISKWIECIGYFCWIGFKFIKLEEF